MASGLGRVAAEAKYPCLCWLEVEPVWGADAPSFCPKSPGLSRRRQSPVVGPSPDLNGPCGLSRGAASGQRPPVYTVLVRFTAVLEDAGKPRVPRSAGARPALSPAATTHTSPQPGSQERGQLPSDPQAARSPWGSHASTRRHPRESLVLNLHPGSLVPLLVRGRVALHNEGP